LMGMRERLELLGGSLGIESAHGEGCSVYARLPSRRA
jgi:signal transduction histidine kinase